MDDQALQDWDKRVSVAIDSVRREASILMWLGFIVYGGGSAAILILMRGQPSLATAAVMFLFQLLVLFFGTRKIYPCIKGAFVIGLMANRDTIPAFRGMQQSADRAVLDFKAGSDKITAELEKLSRVMTVPIRSPDAAKQIQMPVGFLDGKQRAAEQQREAR